MDDCFESENISVDFNKEKNKSIENLNFWYYGETQSETNSKIEYSWIQFELNEEQTKILISFLENEVEEHIPEFNFDFECEIEWSVQCEEKKLEYYVYTSPIKINIKDVIPEED